MNMSSLCETKLSKEAKIEKFLEAKNSTVHNSLLYLEYNNWNLQVAIKHSTYRSGAKFDEVQAAKKVND